LLSSHKTKTAIYCKITPRPWIQDTGYSIRFWACSIYTRIYGTCQLPPENAQRGVGQDFNEQLALGRSNGWAGTVFPTATASCHQIIYMFHYQTRSTYHLIEGIKVRPNSCELLSKTIAGWSMILLFFPQVM